MKLTEKIHLLRIDFEIDIAPGKKLARFVNVLFLFGEKITLVDTGVKGSEKIIFNYIEKNGRAVSEIENIILSHSHPDHIGSAAKIKEITGCKVLAHPGEKTWIENIEIQNAERPVPGFFNLVDQSVKIDRFLNNDEIIKAGENITVKIIHSPGHSKGSLNLQFIEDKILFTADSIPLKNDIPNYDNYFEVLRSLQKIKENKEYSILLTSWTPPLIQKEEIETIFNDGEAYLQKLDCEVKRFYTSQNTDDLSNCRNTIESLGLPPFLANSLVDRTFKSHFKNGSI